MTRTQTSASEMRAQRSREEPRTGCTQPPHAPPRDTRRILCRRSKPAAVDMCQDRFVEPLPALTSSRARAAKQLAALPQALCSLDHSGPYPVQIAPVLRVLAAFAGVWIREADIRDRYESVMREIRRASCSDAAAQARFAASIGQRLSTAMILSTRLREPVLGLTFGSIKLPYASQGRSCLWRQRPTPLRHEGQSFALAQIP